MGILYLLRFIYKGIRELLRTFQSRQMLSQNVFSQRMRIGKELEGNTLYMTCTVAVQSSELP